MNAAQHADQILAAWKKADSVKFEQELTHAMRSCQRPQPANYLESEQRELLASVIERLQLIRPSEGKRPSAFAPCTAQGLNAGFTLLEHLRQRAAA